MRVIIKFGLALGQEVIPITANVPKDLFFTEQGELNIRKLQGWVSAGTVVCQPTTIERCLNET
jgi:hypothetical protein